MNYTIQLFFLQEIFSQFTFFLQLKSKVLSFRARADAAGHFRRGKSDENRILAKAFDLIPRDIKVLRFSQTEKAAVTWDHQRAQRAAVGVKLKIRRIAQTRAVAKIDDFFFL